MPEPGSGSVKLMIVEDQEIAITGLRLVLEQHPALQIVGEARDGKAAISLAQELSPDVILMDIQMPVMDGIESTKQIRALLPNIKVVILTTYSRDDDVFGAFAAGAQGYCLKDISADQLTRAIHAVMDGAGWLDPTIADRVLRNAMAPASEASPPSTAPVVATAQNKKPFDLSARELDVLKLLVEGSSNQDIANRLIISTETVKTHMRHIMEKLRVSDRTQAAVKAMREGLI